MKYQVAVTTTLMRKLVNGMVSCFKVLKSYRPVEIFYLFEGISKS